MSEVESGQQQQQDFSVVDTSQMRKRSAAQHRLDGNDNGDQDSLHSHDEQEQGQEDESALRDDFHFVSYDPATSSYSIVRWLAPHLPTTLTTMLAAYGIMPLATLALIYLLVKGVSITALSLSLLPVFKDGLGVTDSADYQRYSVVAALAWPLKPVIGLVSDSFPVWGYRKRVYLSLAAIAVAALLLGLACVAPHNSSATAVYTATALLFFTNLCFATIDLLCEAVYSRFYVLRPKAGTALVSTCWMLVMSSGVVAAPIVGPLADGGKPFVAVAIVAGLVSLSVLPFAHNWLGEMTVVVAAAGATSPFSASSSSSTVASSPVEMNETSPIAGVESDAGVVPPAAREREETATATASESPRDDSASLKANLRKQAVAMGVICPLTALLSLLLSPHKQHQRHAAAGSFSSSLTHNVAAAPNCSDVLQATAAATSADTAAAVEKLIVPLAAAVALLTCGYRFLPPALFRANTYMFLNEALYLSTSGALDFFFVAKPECLPDGPNFDYTFYDTTTTVISAVFGGIGAVLFHRYFAHMNFQRIFALTTLLKITASLFDIVIVNRWNRSVFGISDKAFFVFGESMVLQVAYTLSFMPAVMLTAHMCPSGLEATTYALLAGFSNFGMSLSGLVGGALTKHVFGIRTSVLKVNCTTTANSNNIIVTTNNYSSALATTLSNQQQQQVVAVASCNFDNLGWLIFVAHFLFPLLTLPLIKYLVPNTKARS